MGIAIKLPVGDALHHPSVATFGVYLLDPHDSGSSFSKITEMTAGDLTGSNIKLAFELSCAKLLPGKCMEERGALPKKAF